MNALWPIIVIIVGAGAWWWLRYAKAPQPMYVALAIVVGIILLIWLLGVLGLMGPYDLRLGRAP